MQNVPYDNKITVLFTDAGNWRVNSDDVKVQYDAFRRPVLERDLQRLIDASVRFLDPVKAAARSSYIRSFGVFKRRIGKMAFIDLNEIDAALQEIHEHYMGDSNAYRPGNMNYLFTALEEDQVLSDEGGYRVTRWRAMAYDTADVMAALWAKLTSDTGQAELYRAEKRDGNLDKLKARWLDNLQKDDFRYFKANMQQFELGRILDIRNAHARGSQELHKPVALLPHLRIVAA